MFQSEGTSCSVRASVDSTVSVADTWVATPGRIIQSPRSNWPTADMFCALGTGQIRPNVFSQSRNESRCGYSVSLRDKHSSPDAQHTGIRHDFFKLILGRSRGVFHCCQPHNNNNSNNNDDNNRSNDGDCNLYFEYLG